MYRLLSHKVDFFCKRDLSVCRSLVASLPTPQQQSFSLTFGQFTQGINFNLLQMIFAAAGSILLFQLVKSDSHHGLKMKKLLAERFIHIPK